MRVHKTLVQLTSITFLLFSALSSANLIIHPTRIDFDPTERAAEVSILNDSEKTNTYRIEWVEKQATAIGGYKDLKPELVNKQIIASPMVRYAPRQVTLKPGERQVVKLSLRRPARLQQGDYRSHLMFRAIPTKGEGPAKAAEQGVQMQLTIVPSFAIPVVVRHGELNYKVAAKSAEIFYSAANPAQSKVRVHMSRQGQHSVYGEIMAYWTPAGGKEVELAKAGGVSYWTDLNDTTADLGWIGADFALTNGKLRVVYKGIRDFQGKVFFDQTFDIQRGQIKSM